MSCHQQPATVQWQCRQRAAVIGSPRRFASHEQRVNDRVTGDKDCVGINTLTKQIISSASSWCEVQVTDMSGYYSIDFVGKWIGSIIAAQTSLHMSHFNLSVMGSNGGRHYCRCIALYKHPVRLMHHQDRLQTGENSSGDAGRRLVRAHKIKIYIGFDTKEVKHAVK